MRIVLIGQAAFGADVLKALVAKGEEVVGVYAPPDPPGKVEPLKEAAEKLGVPVFQPKGMRAPETYEQYTSLEPELNVMAFVTYIIPESILEYPRLGTIQYHPSLLPKHRGANAMNWAIINGETKTGLSIFWPDKGLDTGPILLQKEVEIAPDDTVVSLYFNKLFPMGVAAMLESVELVKKGQAPRIVQDESQATYEGLCSDEDAIIDWNQPVSTVYNLIRGTNPQPGANTSFQGKRVKIFDSERVADSQGGAPGEVVGITDKGLVVAAQGGSILVKRVRPDGSPKIAAGDFVKQVGLKAGDKLGS